MTTILAQLEMANRQIDRVIREITLMKGQARDVRTVSKVMLISKLEHLEGSARECECTLERMTNDARIAVSRETDEAARK